VYAKSRAHSDQAKQPAWPFSLALDFYKTMPVSKNRRKRSKPQKVKRQSKDLILTVALYGPDDSIATKMVGSVVNQATGKIEKLEKWFSEDGTDVRENNRVVEELAALITKSNPREVISPGQIIGCPHEEGLDYPEGEACPECPYWKGRDRFTGELLQ